MDCEAQDIPTITGQILCCAACRNPDLIAATVSSSSKISENVLELICHPPLSSAAMFSVLLAVLLDLR